MWRMIVFFLLSALCDVAFKILNFIKLIKFALLFNYVYICINKIKQYMDKVKQLPKLCPSCGSVLRVKTMQCAHCQTSVEGDYQQPALMSIAKEDQEFIVNFVLCSGSLKEMAHKMGLSYPTVRNRLDDLIAVLKQNMETEE